MLEKNLADYTASECLAEITKRGDRDVELLALQLHVLHGNQERRCRDLEEVMRANALRNSVALQWLRALRHAYHRRKTVPFDEVERASRMAEQSITSVQLDAELLRRGLVDALEEYK